MPTLLFLLPLLPFSTERTRIHVLLIKHYYLALTGVRVASLRLRFKAGFYRPLPRVRMRGKMEEVAAAKSFFEGPYLVVPPSSPNWSWSRNQYHLK